LPRLLSYAAAQLRQAGTPGHALLSCDELTRLPASAPTDVLKWQAISGLLLTQGGDWRKSVNKNDGFPPNDRGGASSSSFPGSDRSRKPGGSRCASELRWVERSPAPLTRTPSPRRPDGRWRAGWPFGRTHVGRGWRPPLESAHRQPSSSKGGGSLPNSSHERGRMPAILAPGSRHPRGPRRSRASSRIVPPERPDSRVALVSVP
jgi:hypothetical protein